MNTKATCFLALLLLSGSACTEVSVSVHQPDMSSALTGTNCKLQRELRNQDQKTDFWCWAASAHTVIEYLKQEPIVQCDLVNAVFQMKLKEKNRVLVGPSSDPLPHCCMATAKFLNDRDPWYVKKSINTCWKTGWPDLVFDQAEFRMNFELYEYDWTTQDPQGLGWDEITAEICADRPMISAIAFSGPDGGAHTVVIGGYTESDDGTQWVHVYDPGYSTLEGDYYLWPYEIYLGDPGVFTHVRDYTSISLP